MIYNILRTGILLALLTAPALSASSNCEVLQALAALSQKIKQTQSQINLCCESINNNISNSTQLIINTINACCSTLEGEIGEIINLLTACGTITPIFQSDIPLNITVPGRYCLAEDVVVGKTVAQGIRGLLGKGLTEQPAVQQSSLGSFGIAITAKIVDLHLNNHTMTELPGSNINAIGTIGESSHIRIHNGIIVGSGDLASEDCTGINILTSNVIVSDVEIDNLVGLNSAGIAIQGFFLPTPTAQETIRFGLEGVLIKRCNFSFDYAGITFGNYCTNVIVQDCSIDKSLFTGINEPARGGYSSNILIKNTAISNSTFHGIYSTFNQSNWILDGVQISNSGLNGMILSGFQTLSLHRCQVFNSGSYGITASIRQNQNFEMSNCQIFNAQNSTLRIDNASNVLLNNCQLTNYFASTEPVVKLQDIFNGSISDCLVNSSAGTSDGIFIRNCHGFSVEKCKVNILCNEPHTGCPIGINLQGGVTTTVVKNCIISGNPSIGIAIQPDEHNFTNTGVGIKNCTVQGAVVNGILVSNSSACSIFNSEISDGQGTGIFLDENTSNCPVRNNTLTNNGVGIPTVFGISNKGTNNQIYHNFASGNGTNYDSGVPFVVKPSTGLGVLENISG